MPAMMDKGEKGSWEGGNRQRSMRQPMEHICVLMDLIPSCSHVTQCMQTPRALCPLLAPALHTVD